ncbi:MAG: class I SAM-dependent methyltransferase [Arcobacteraceae bacterium]|nr:class I SAM-dependent methyltransferase [Arcobacteraceae bacterium]
MAQEHNNKFYQKAINEYGISAQGVHWNSKHTQYKRFEIITKFIKKEIATSSIIDVGCGFGEYYKYLEVNNKLPQKYFGIDCEEDMVTVCKKRLPFQEFKKQNILTDDLIKGDYYICSGALNILTVDEVYTFITKCFEICTKGFIFNFLKSHSYNNLQVDEVTKFCKQLSPMMKTKDNYLNNDFTIFMVKP